MEQQTGWSTRKLRLVFGCAGALLIALAVWLLRHNQLSPEPVVSTPPPPPAVRPGPTVGSDELSELPTGEREDIAMRDPAWERTAQFGEALPVEDVAATLQQADAALSAGRLLEPPTDNALQRYLAVKAVEPENQAALDGLEHIATQIVSQLDQLLAQRDLDRAAELFPILNRLRDADDAERVALGRRFQQLQQANSLATKVEQNLSAGRLVDPPQRSAFGRLRQLQALDPEHPRLAALLDEVEAKFLEQAVTSANSVAFEDAEGWLQWAQRLRPESIALATARNQVGRLFREQVTERESSALAAIREYRFDSATDLIAELEELGAAPAQLERLSDRLRLGRLYGNHLPGDVISDPLPSAGTAPPVVVVPHGQFQMGASRDDRDRSAAEEPAFQVTFARGFALGKTEVTVAQFARFVNATDYQTDAEMAGFSYRYHESTGRLARSKRTTWRDNYEGRRAADDDPVTHVSWRDATAFAGWLSEQTGQVYRLPSEAEFEYALRAGSTSRYWWGDAEPPELVENLTGSEDRSRHRNQWISVFDGYGDKYWGPAPVASFAANPFALYDMAGNVSEWVADCWHDSYVRAPTDGSAWVNRGCERRVARGGYWGGAPDKNRSSYRASYPEIQRGGSIGFRVARDLFPPAEQRLTQE